MADDTAPIEITDERDLAFMRVAQGSLLNATTLPSGTLTPARNLIVEGTSLVEPTDVQVRHFGAMHRRSRY